MDLLEQLKDIMGEVLTEELHQDLQNILSSDKPTNTKHSLITKKIRTLIKNGEDTGLEDDKPKKGSSRAVYFPKEEKEITIDGVKTKMPTALKIAFPGYLDKYRDTSEPLLGEMQNEVETDRYIRQNHSVLRNHEGDDRITYNEHGVLAPVVDHADDGSWLEMGKVSKITGTKFKALTKNADFPKGISHFDFMRHLMNEHDRCHGRHPMFNMGHEDRIADHPLCEATKHLIFDTGVHPADFHLRNLGVWKHPVTGKEHVVIADYGYNHDTDKAYEEARQKERNSGTTIEHNRIGWNPKMGVF